MTVKCLVIGHGSSIDYELIRNFDGIILSTDICAAGVIEHDIIPDYQLYSEIKESVIQFLVNYLPDTFLDSEIRNKMTVVYRYDAIPALVNRVGRMKLKSEIFDAHYGTTDDKAVNNVGLYSIAYADIILKADEVHLTGMDYRGVDVMGNDLSASWIERAQHYLKNRKHRSKIIDHSGGDFPV